MTIIGNYQSMKLLGGQCFSAEGDLKLTGIRVVRLNCSAGGIISGRSSGCSC